MTAFPRSIFTRIVLLSAGLSALLLAGLWWTADRTIRETFDTATQESVDVDLAGLVDIYASGDRSELERRIADRLAMTPSDGAQVHYLLADAAGNRIAGDLTRWPGLDPATSESGPITIEDGTQAHGRATLLAEDLQLIVAHETPGRDPLLSRIALVFLLGGGVFVVAIALFAQLAGRQVRRRVAGVSSAFRGGDDQALASLAAAERSDEIDEIARQAALALKRDRQLMAAYRETSEQVAHEIRTPLSHLDARLVKALAGDPEPSTAGHLVAAREEIRQLVCTLEGLLDIAANKAGASRHRHTDMVDLSNLTRGICELYQDSAEEAGYPFHWDIDPEVTIPGDEAQLGRIVTNLLDNAFKYNLPGGAISVRLEAGPRLTIADSGPGIAPADRARVFDRFYRGAAAAAGDQPGAGLGLALAQAIAGSHGLAIELVDSAHGACFQVLRRTEECV